MGILPMEWSEHKGKGGVGPLILKKEIVLNVVSDLSDTHMWIIGLKSVSQNQTLSNANLSFTTCDTEQNAQINVSGMSLFPFDGGTGHQLCIKFHFSAYASLWKSISLKNHLISHQLTASHISCISLFQL